jgi:hypothetical protein
VRSQSSKKEGDTVLRRRQNDAGRWLGILGRSIRFVQEMQSEMAMVLIFDKSFFSCNEQQFLRPEKINWRQHSFFDLILISGASFPNAALQ